jgi:hypothetical protein
MKRTAYRKVFAAASTSEYHLTQDVDTEQKLDIIHSYYRSHSHLVKHKRYHNGGILSSELLDSLLPVVRDFRERNPIQGSPWIPKTNTDAKFWYP